MPEANKLQVAVLAADGFEESELTETVRALTDAGAKTIQDHYRVTPRGPHTGVQAPR